MKRYWRELSTREFSTDTSRWIAVLPLAAIEQHGPHLPVSVDSIIAQGMVERCAEALPDENPAIFLPVQEIGKSNEHVNFPGTLTLDWETAIKSWVEIGAGVVRAGLRKMVLVTSHGGNISCMDIAARELREKHDMLVVCTSWEKLGHRSAIFENGPVYTDIHGGEAETSIMLAMRPDLVDMRRAEDFASQQRALKEDNTQLGFHSSNGTISWLAEDLNPIGVVGNAEAATAEKGRHEIYSAVDGFCTLMMEIDGINLPAQKD